MITCRHGHSSMDVCPICRGDHDPAGYRPDFADRDPREYEAIILQDDQGGWRALIPTPAAS